MANHIKLRLRSTGLFFATEVNVAETFSSRLRGLLFRPPLRPTEGLLIRPCNQVHMFFMSFAIDVVFCSADLEVIRCYSNLKPWQITRIVHGARTAIELAAGTIEKAGIRPGDKIEVC
jgi:uncharacterized membrane protein (UPF0127 family)